MATQRELAKHLATNEHEVRDLVALGVLPKPVRGVGYDLDECRVLLFRHLRRQVATGEDAERKRDRQDIVDDINKERARQAAETADKLALENAVRRRELVPVAELRDALLKVAGLVRANLEAWPAMLKRAAPHLRNSEVAVIKREIAKLSDAVADIDLRNPDTT